MTFQDIRYEVKDNVAWLTLNRPDKLNALTWGTHAEIESAIDQAERDDEVRCVVITGEGRGFSAGTDLTDRTPEEQLPARPETGRPGKLRSRYRSTERVYACAKPTIAAVNGVSVGAGFSLALACDIRLAHEKARFSAIFVKRAIVADTGATWFLPRLIGPEQAYRMLYTGAMVGAEEALRIGLVSEVLPDDAFQARVAALAGEIAHGPSVAVELIKRLAQQAYDVPLGVQIDHEAFLQQVSHATEDREEGVQSFMEKREPVFKGR